MRELGPLPWAILNKHFIEWKMVGCVEDVDIYHDEVGVDIVTWGDVGGYVTSI